MAEKTKRKYVGELMNFTKSLKRPLHFIQEELPYDNENNILIINKEAIS